MKKLCTLFSLCLLVHFSVFGQSENRATPQKGETVRLKESDIRDAQIQVMSRENWKDIEKKRYAWRDSTDFEANIDPDFFLLGTHDDYMGRSWAIRPVDRLKHQIDRYYSDEETLANYIDRFIEANYGIKVDLQFEKSRHSKMFSKPIAEKLNRYYDLEGNLKEGILDTEEKMYSFLTGVLLRYGTNLFDDVFEIRVINSPKNKEIYELLKALRCDNIIYKDYRGYIPNSKVFYFEATPRIIKYFDIIRTENEIFRHNENKYEKMFKGNEEAFEIFKQRRVELENSIRTIFKK
jgi:hypothetical protein